MDHEDIDQVPVYTDGKEYWCTLCACGKAFWNANSQRAYEAWEQHEADEA